MIVKILFNAAVSLSILIGTLGLVGATGSNAQSVTQTGSQSGTQSDHGQSGLNVCDRLVRNTERVKVTPVARPPYLRLFKEPGFGTNSRRITDSIAGEVHKPAGAPAPAWNIDESILLLHRYGNEGLHDIVLLDGTKYEELGSLALPDVNSEDIYWSHTDPEILYFVSDSGVDAGKLMQINVRTSERNTLKDFTPVCESVGYAVSPGQFAKPSYDNGSFGYRCAIENQQSLALAYQSQSDTVQTLPVGEGTRYTAALAPQPSPDGKHFVLGENVFTASLEPLEHTIDMADIAAPSTIAASADGRNVVFQSASVPSPNGCGRDLWNGIGLVIEHDIQDAQCRPVVNQTDNYPVAPLGTEMSATAYHSPAWLAMASVAYDDLDYFSNKRFAPVLLSEVYLVNTTDKDDTEVCRLAHHRSFGQAANNARYEAALGDPNVTISPTATRVLFASDWYDSGFVDTYVLELPTFSRYDINGVWVDAHDSRVITEIVQRGGQVTFQRRLQLSDAEAILNTQGSGEIKANKMQIDYVVQASKNRQVSGTCQATITTDSASIEFECRDYYFGRLVTTLIRPE